MAAVADGSVALDKIDSRLLPENMQKMTPQQQAEYIAARQAERDGLAARIKELSGRRAGYIRNELKKAGGAADGFDAKVVEAVREQGARKNIAYK